MSTSTIGQYFSNRVEELISEFAGHTLIFFKGFGLEQNSFPDSCDLSCRKVQSCYDCRIPADSSYERSG